VPVALELTRGQQRFLWSLLAVIVAVRLATLAAYPLPDPSESRYAEMARKMLETGNWLVPQFDYGTPFWGKPPLSIWLTAAAMSAFGVNEFAARLPSTLLTIGCGALVYAIAHAAAGRAAALLCAVVFATMGLVFVGAGAVVTDPSLTFGTTLAMAGFWLAADGPPAARRAWGFAFFAGIAIGLLAKGPVAVVLTVFPIGAWIVWQRQWRGLHTRLPWIAGTLLVVVLVVPWYWAVERATPGFLDYFLIGEHWKRFTEPGWTGDRYGVAHAWKRGWIWLFWVAAAAPWSIVAIDWMVRVVSAPREQARARLADPLLRYVLCWALSPLVFFTASGNVLITYVLPGLPAFALVLGLFGPVASEATRTLDRAEKRAFAACGVLAVALVAALVTQHARIDREFAQRALVRAYEAQRADPQARLVYVGDEPVSAEFYTHGKAERVAHPAALAPYFADAHRDFFAVRDDDFARFAAADRARLLPVATFGKFRLFTEAPPPAPGSALAPPR
jgi:4-amino-4-deoxy-L-arabinose transferase-like glycosyltransferase